MVLPWVLCGVFMATVIVLLFRLRLVQKNVDEIHTELARHLSEDTNTLISISSRDRHIRRLAETLNVQLRDLRKQRRRYLSGDEELKAAVTNISHDLRTPLTAICGYLDLLEAEEKSENAARYIALIQSRAQALKQLTEEFFRYSVILSVGEAFQLEDININAALEESIAAFYPDLVKRGIAPVIQMPEKQIRRQANLAALSRVFGNILSNALKYSDGDLEITLLDSGEIIFANTASKLDEVQVGKLFDRFFTVEAARNSTGLGLAISKALTEQMNGSITAEYRSGKLFVHIVL
jgi:Signal transduction histidine kinase